MGRGVRKPKYIKHKNNRSIDPYLKCNLFFCCPLVFYRWGKVFSESTTFWRFCHHTATLSASLRFSTIVSVTTCLTWLSSTHYETTPGAFHFFLFSSTTPPPWRKPASSSVSLDSWRSVKRNFACCRRLPASESLRTRMNRCDAGCLLKTF